MGGNVRDPDILDEWLRGDGLAALDGLTSGAMDVIGVTDRNFIVRYVNWTAPGLTREAVVGMNVLDLVPPAYKDLSRDTYTRVLDTGVAERFETLYSDEQGVLIWVVRVGPVRHQGEVIGIITISTDVTEQRAGSVDRDRFFSLSLDMLIVVTREGRLKRVNPAFGAALGYETSELIGRPFLDFVNPDDHERTLVAFADVVGGLPVTDFENRYRRRDGKFRVFSWRATVDPVTSDVYAVARDITEQRTTEAQLRHAQKMEAVGQLAGGIAHDFNNLMQAVLANVELAQLLPSLPPSVTEHLDEIAEAGSRAAELTKQLLVFSRRQPLHRVPVVLDELLVGMMKLLQRLLPESIAIEHRPGASLPSVSADRTQLEQVLLNLCVNARDAMEGGGRLVLETSQVVVAAHECEQYPWVKPGRFTCLAVTDTGAGMSVEVRERIFDPFFTTKGQHRGTGLGLATVYGIVQHHGGFVRVDSTVGHGTTFKVYLPADERPSEDRDAIGSAGGGPLRGHETLLIAEDEALVRKPMILLLEGAGYRTLAAASGREAIEIFHRHADEIDLVLLDVVMPELGGPETWARLQSMRPGLRALFMSGYADEAYRRRLPAGADVLEKPFGNAELLRRLRNKLDAG